jgi:hypothetical protein
MMSLKDCLLLCLPETSKTTSNGSDLLELTLVSSIATSELQELRLEELSEERRLQEEVESQVLTHGSNT